MKLSATPAATRAAAALITIMSRRGPHSPVKVCWIIAAFSSGEPPRMASSRARNAKILRRHRVALDLPVEHFRNQRFAGQRNLIEPARAVNHEGAHDPPFH